VQPTKRLGGFLQGPFKGLTASAVPPLDPSFLPPALILDRYRQEMERHGGGEPLVFALEREGGLISRYEMAVVSPERPGFAVSLFLAERILKFLLWSRGGARAYVAGPTAICEHLRDVYSPAGDRRFDIELMERVYERPFEVRPVALDDVPADRAMAGSLGGHLDGCRIGFDLGASDYKLAAVIDGEPVFTEEIPWNPKDQPDPAYHRDRIQEGLELAASHLPRVDAIGGSSAGIYIDNRVLVASLFRSVPEEVFASQVKSMFLDLQESWGVPLQVVNDGDVTALAGTLSLEKEGMLGVAMGSSEAAGFLNKEGHLTGWLNELAFGPVDFCPSAAADEWSGDTGVGAMYFSQQAVNRLAPAAGMTFPEEMPLPERLVLAQEQADRGNEGVGEIFATIGTYLGYTIPWYSEFYDFDDLLILGRVTSGRGGEILLSTAKDVLKNEFPEVAERFALHVPDEKSRRVGQAVAAASLPELSA
jgi:predicted NBD/HSP70 family sugar kinase